MSNGQSLYVSILCPCHGNSRRVLRALEAAVWQSRLMGLTPLFSKCMTLSKAERDTVDFESVSAELSPCSTSQVHITIRMARPGCQASLKSGARERILSFALSARVQLNRPASLARRLEFPRMTGNMLSYYGNCSSPWESLILFEAAKQNMIPIIEHRLTDVERRNIVSGAVFIWDERKSSIRRWTDGITWSNSRVVGDFLEYRELLSDSMSGDPPRRYSVKPYGLCKRTLCLASSDNPEDSRLRLISYYSKRDALSGSLPLPSKNPEFAPIVKQLEAAFGEGIFKRNPSAAALSGVFKRNPSPTRDRRRIRSEGSLSNLKTAAPRASPALKQPVMVSETDLQSSEVSRMAAYSMLPSIQQLSQDSRNTVSVVINTGSTAPHKLGPANTNTSVDLSGFERLLMLSQEARGDAGPNCGASLAQLPFLPNPRQGRGRRADRINSEDLKLLGKLDSCVNAHL